MSNKKLKRRVKAAQLAVDKYKDLPFSFEQRHDCGRIAMFAMKELGVLPKELRKVGEYSTALAAKKVLRDLGVNTVGEAMDLFFERIAPAASLPADVVEIPGEDESIGSLGLALGNGVVLAYHEEHEGAVVGHLVEATAAWRLLPL